MEVKEDIVFHVVNLPIHKYSINHLDLSIFFIVKTIKIISVIRIGPYLKICNNDHSNTAQ